MAYSDVSAYFALATFSEGPSFFACVFGAAYGVMISAKVFAFGILRALLVVGLPTTCILRRDLLTIMSS